jgi:hypothetical protein
MSNSRYNLFIEKTRGLDDKIRNYKSYVVDDHYLRQIANWENKTSANLYKNREQEEINSLKNQKEIFLNMRRNKLSNLLKKEYEQYHQELINNINTPEHQRQMMEKKLQDLKNIKEEERQKYVELQKEKIFFNDNEEVRKHDNEYNNMKCCFDQEDQMIDKMKRRYNNYLEEKAFDDINKIDYLKKLEREKKEEEERIKKNKELNEYRAFQRQQELENLERINELNKLEKEKLKQQWKIDEQNELKEKIYKRELNKKVNEDIEYYNKIEKEKREEKEKIEKEQDKKMIEEILKKERALNEIDRMEKLRKKDELMKNSSFLKYKMQQKKEEEEWMDKLADEEREKQYEKEQKQWLKEQAARIELMKEVYRRRAEEIMRKKNLEEKEKQELIKEREILDKEIDNYNDQYWKLKEDEFKKNKEEQDILKYQMQYKIDLKNREKQEEMYQKRMAELLEEEYQNKLKALRQIHLQKLEALKKTRYNNFVSNDF